MKIKTRTCFLYKKVKSRLYKYNLLQKLRKTLKNSGKSSWLWIIKYREQ